jgi:uncharacterized membrane protein
VVVTFCIKISIQEAIVMPTPGWNLRPKMYLSWWVLGTSTATTIAFLLVHSIAPIAKVLGETSDSLFTITFLLFILLISASCFFTDFIFQTFQFYTWEKGHNKYLKTEARKKNVTQRLHTQSVVVHVSNSEGIVFENL